MNPTTKDSVAAAPTAPAPEVEKPAAENGASAPEKGNRNSLFSRRGKAPKREGVVLSDGKAYEVEGCSPYEMAWITEQGISRDLEKGEVKLDSTERNFYMVAIGLREDGHRMFEGSPENPTLWHYGAKKIATEMENSDFDKLFKAVNTLSGYSREAKLESGKGFAKTPITE